MNTQTSSEPKAVDQDIQKALNVAIAAAERGDFSGAHELFRLIYERPSADQLPATGLSYYGRCILRTGGRSRRAIELAEQARKREFYDSRHWANLVRIYIETGSRRRAVSTLEDGLKRMPRDRTLLRVRDEIGYRKPPPLRFLHRDNPINVFFGKRPHLLHPSKTVKIAVVVTWFLLLMAGTFYVLLENSGF